MNVNISKINDPLTYYSLEINEILENLNSQAKYAKDFPEKYNLTQSELIELDRKIAFNMRLAVYLRCLTLRIPIVTGFPFLKIAISFHDDEVHKIYKELESKAERLIFKEEIDNFRSILLWHEFQLNKLLKIQRETIYDQY